MLRTIHSTVAIVALVACARDAPRPGARRDAGVARIATPDAARPDASTLPPHRSFATLAEAITAIVPPDARVLGFGELHVRTDRPGVRPPLARFRDDILPALAAKLSDLVLETWIVDPKCGAKGKAATARVESTMKRPEATKDDLATTIEAARAAGVKIHAMRMECTDYEKVAPAAGVEVEILLDLVTRELGRIAASAIVYRDREAVHRPLIAVYGGALHNDRFPVASVAQWSYAAGVDRVAADRFVELDLFAPELAAADPLYAQEDWFPLVAAATPDRVIVFDRGLRSFIVILPSTPAAAAPTPAPAPAK